MIQADGGVYEAICGKKMDPKMNEESDETTMKPQEQKDKEKAQNKVKKNSCAWLTEEEKGNFEFHNYTGA